MQSVVEVDQRGYKSTPENIVFGGIVGNVVVPASYEHNSCIASFRQDHWAELDWRNADFNDQKFRRPSYIFRPGETFRVVLYEITEWTSISHCLEYFKNAGALLVGAQGIVIAYMQLREVFEAVGSRKNMSCLSLDVEDNLPREEEVSLAPCVSFNRFGHGIGLECLRMGFSSPFNLLGFRKVSQ